MVPSLTPLMRFEASPIVSVSFIIKSGSIRGKFVSSKSDILNELGVSSIITFLFPPFVMSIVLLFAPCMVSSMTDSVSSSSMVFIVVVVIVSLSNTFIAVSYTHLTLPTILLV